MIVGWALHAHLHLSIGLDDSLENLPDRGVLYLLIDGQVQLIDLVPDKQDRDGLARCANDGQPVLFEANDGLFAGYVIDEYDEVTVFDLLKKIWWGGGVYYLSEDIFGVGAHVGGKDYFLMGFRDFGDEVWDDGADEGGLAYSF